MELPEDCLWCKVIHLTETCLNNRAHQFRRFIQTPEDADIVTGAMMVALGRFLGKLLAHQPNVPDRAALVEAVIAQIKAVVDEHAQDAGSGCFTWDNHTQKKTHRGTLQ